MAIRRGQVVAIDFDDHICNDTRPAEFVCYGEVAKVTRTHLVIDCWAYRNSRKPHDDNEARFTILRSTIRKVTRLVPEKRKP